MRKLDHSLSFLPGQGKVSCSLAQILNDKRSDYCLGDILMEVYFRDKQQANDVAEGIMSILKMFSERYGIEDFREIQLSMTLVDSQGDDVELIDSVTNEVFKVFEVVKAGEEPKLCRSQKPQLRLVVDNS